MENNEDRSIHNDNSAEHLQQEVQSTEAENHKEEVSEKMVEENLHEFYSGQGQDYLDLTDSHTFSEDKEEEPVPSRDAVPTENPILYNPGSYLAEDQAAPIVQGNGFAEAHREETPPKRKKKKLGKTILATVGGIAAVAVIAFSSIGVYTVFFEKPAADTAAPAKDTQKEIVQTSSTGNELSVAEIAAKVTPSVVGINVESPAGSGTGTGIIMSSDGYIVTNAHVVSGMSKISVVLMDETEYDATVIGTDSQTDLAVIKIDASGLTAAEFGNSDELAVGDEVVAIGNPLGMDFAGSVANGIISGLNREVEIEGQVMNYIQTNASINSGNSGGPLVNGEGQIIGINSAKISSAIAEGMGFAIPINDAVPIINELKENGYIGGRPQIGIGGKDIDEATAQYYNVPPGVLVQQVSPGSGAADADIQSGDIITAINGTEISSVAELNRVKNELKPGDTIELTTYRNGRTGTVKVVLTEQDSQ